MEKLIAKGLLEIKAVFLRPEDPFTWASGIKSPIYCDNRLTLTAPEVTHHPLVDRHRNDTVSDIRAPIGGNACRSLHNSKQRSHRGGGAIGIVSAVDRREHRALEIALAPKQTDHGVRNVCRGLDRKSVV